MSQVGEDTVEALITQFRADVAAHALKAGMEDGALGIDELMRRLDAELGHAPATQNTAALPRWTPAQPELPSRRAYSLHELLQLDDALLVDTAYRVLLHRMPDPDGRSYYVDALRKGALTRIGMLAALRWSPEGIARGIHVDGLLLPHLLERAQRWPLVGPLIGWFRGLARLHTIGLRLETLRQSQAREWQSLGDAHNRLVEELGQRLAGMQGQAEAQAILLQKLEERLDVLIGGAVQRLDALEAAHSHEALAFEGLERRVEEAAGRFDSLEATIGLTVRKQSEEIDALRIHADELDRRAQATAIELAELEPKVRAFEAMRRAQLDLLKDEQDRRRELDPLYSRFEMRFRGEPEVIRRRVETYLPLVRQPGIGDADSPVVDVGSGRGEWLDALRAAGMHASGIDTNQDFVLACRTRGLAVTEADALAALSELPDGSVGAVTSMHLVEHLPFEVLVGLIDQAYRVLKPGGVLILETPNPENVNVGSHWFYLDPTHRNPLPPAMLSWLVADRGFADVEVRRQTEHRDFEPPEPIADDVAGSRQFNEVLAGYRAAPDYAVVAWRR